MLRSTKVDTAAMCVSSQFERVFGSFWSRRDCACSSSISSDVQHLSPAMAAGWSSGDGLGPSVLVILPFPGS